MEHSKDTTQQNNILPEYLYGAVKRMSKEREREKLIKMCQHLDGKGIILVTETIEAKHDLMAIAKLKSFNVPVITYKEMIKAGKLLKGKSFAGIDDNIETLTNFTIL